MTQFSHQNLIKLFKVGEKSQRTLIGWSEAFSAIWLVLTVHSALIWPTDTSSSNRKLTTNYCHFEKVWQHRSIIFREQTLALLKTQQPPQPAINIYIFSFLHSRHRMPKNEKSYRTLWRRQIMLFAVVYLFLVPNYWLCKKTENLKKKPQEAIEILCFALRGIIFYFTGMQWTI